ncbi:hypothetical protein, partial [Lactococcus petauri]|uniref:hypothetical protein n=1 Tax=Lactococcus petauri TaxID=1940789 RepID=UPI0021F15EDE
PPNSGTIYYWLKNLISGNEVEGSVNSNLPTTTTAMYGGVWYGSGSTSGQHQGAVGLIYMRDGMP